MTPFEFIISVFAVIGVGQLVTKERGLFGMFEHLRWMKPESEIGQLLNCPYCLMVWLAPLAMVWAMYNTNLPEWVTWLVYTLATIGAAYVIRRFGGLDYK